MNINREPGEGTSGRHSEIDFGGLLSLNLQLTIHIEHEIKMKIIK
jgi:hypothetical protein